MPERVVAGPSIKRSLPIVVVVLVVLAVLGALPGGWGTAYGQTIVPTATPTPVPVVIEPAPAPVATTQAPTATAQAQAANTAIAQGISTAEANATAAQAQSTAQGTPGAPAGTGNQGGSAQVAVLAGNTQVQVNGQQLPANTTIVATVTSIQQVLDLANSILRSLATGVLSAVTSATGNAVTGAQSALTQTTNSVFAAATQFLQATGQQTSTIATPVPSGQANANVEQVRDVAVRARVEASTAVELTQNGQALQAVAANAPPLEIKLTIPVSTGVDGIQRFITILIRRETPGRTGADLDAMGMVRLLRLPEALFGILRAPAPQVAPPRDVSLLECPPLQILESFTVDPAARAITAQTRCMGVLSLLEMTTSPPVPNYDIAGSVGGHFFSQANGTPNAQTGVGYMITDDNDVRLWSEFQRLGGVPALGYPAASRVGHQGFVTQVTQKAVLQWRPELQTVWFANVFDELHDAGLDSFLFSTHLIPPPFDLNDGALPGCVAKDAALCNYETARNHYALLERADVPVALREAYWSDSDPLSHWGLPVAVWDFGDVYVVRAQRAAFQFWRTDQPFARAGSVTVVNGGDLSKQAGFWSRSVTMPIFAPAAA